MACPGEEGGGGGPGRRPGHARPGVHGRRASLLDLPDDLLLSILQLVDPLPDGFSTGRACKRLHRLMGSDSLKLRVSPDRAAAASSLAAAATRARTPRPAGRASYRTLASAVAASRPGDTLLLDSGVGGSVFSCPAIPVSWPLCLAAAAPAAAAPTLAATAGAPAALIFHASSRLVGLAVTSSPTTGGACLDHRGGVLVIEACDLEVLGQAPPSSSTTTTTPHRRRRPPTSPVPCLPFLHSPILSTARTAGAAVHVHETRLAGAGAGAVAVRAPAGVLSGVRVVGGDLFWLSVITQAAATQAAAALVPWGSGRAGGGAAQGGAGSVPDLAARAKVWRAGRRREAVQEATPAAAPPAL